MLNKVLNMSKDCQLPFSTFKGCRLSRNLKPVEGGSILRLDQNSLPKQLQSPNTSLKLKRVCTKTTPALQAILNQSRTGSLQDPKMQGKETVSAHKEQLIAVKVTTYKSEPLFLTASSGGYGKPRPRKIVYAVHKYIPVARETELEGKSRKEIDTLVKTRLDKFCGKGMLKAASTHGKTLPTTVGTIAGKILTKIFSNLFVSQKTPQPRIAPIISSLETMRKEDAGQEKQKLQEVTRFNFDTIIANKMKNSSNSSQE